MRLCRQTTKNRHDENGIQSDPSNYRPFHETGGTVPCQTASAEETCDHLTTTWISRYGCPVTFQLDNGKAFVGDLTNELMKRSHIAKDKRLHPRLT